MPENPNSADPFGKFDGYTPTEPSLPTAPQELEELEHRLREWIRISREAKTPYEQDWELYRCYVKGDQLVVRNRDTNDVVRLSRTDSKKLRSINNQLRPIARSLVGKLAAQIPTCVVIPASSDVEEQHGARVASALLQFFRRKDRLDTKYLNINAFLPAFGNAFAQVVWNPAQGRKVAYCEICHYFEPSEKLIGTPCPQCTAQRQDELAIQQTNQETANAQALSEVLGQLPPDVVPSPDMLPQDTPQVPVEQLGPLTPDQEPPGLTEAKEGDVSFVVRDPRDTFFPPGLTDITEAKEYAVRQVMSVPEARAMFPEQAQEIGRDNSVYTDREARFRFGISDYRTEMRALEDHCWVWQFYEWPTEQYDTGRLISMVNDKVVKIEANPYHFLDRINLFHFGFDENPGELWREPFLAQAWHRQKELNLLETQEREHVEKLLRPPLLVPNGSQISADEFGMESARVMKFNNVAGFPTYVSPPPLPQGLEQRKLALIQDMRTQAAISESEMGISNSDPNGRAMAIIAAEADRQVGPIIVKNNEEWREAHRIALILAQKYYHTDRVITVAGTDGIQTFSFAELNLSPGWDVQIEEQDGMSRNPAIRFKEAMDLAQVGGGALFIDPRTGQFDAKKFSRLAKLRLPDEGYDTEAMQRASASKIPHILKKGEVWAPRTFDSPELFVDELYAWLNGPGRHVDQQLSQEVEAVWQYYNAWLVTGQMQPTQGMQGQASQPGGPSAPGGTPGNPGGLGTDMGTGLAGNADAQVANADAYGESLAQQGQSHES